VKKKSIFREFLHYITMNMLGMVGLSCYIFADTFFIANRFGPDGISAINLAMPIFGFILAAGLMIGHGGGTRYSIHRGRGEPENANDAFMHSLYIWAILSALFFVCGVFFSEQIARLMGADESVIDMSRLYLRMMLLFAPIFLLNHTMQSFIRNDGAPQLSMFAMIFGNIMNIILDYVFIYPLNMGIFGAALATVLSPIWSLAILSTFFFRKKNNFRLKKTALRIQQIGRVLTSGVPTLITEVCSSIVIIVYNTVTYRLMGNLGIASYGIVANTAIIILAIFSGIAQGTQPLLSRYYGAGELKKVRTIFRYGIITILSLAVVLYAVILIGADQITALFNSEKDPVMQQVASTGARLYFAAVLFAGANLLFSVFFTSTEYPRPAFVISIMRGIAVIAPLIYLFSTLFEMTGVFMAFPATELITALAGFVFYRLRRKQLISQLPDTLPA
jgi:putative MATE family efflux protein